MNPVPEARVPSDSQAISGTELDVSFNEGRQGTNRIERRLPILKGAKALLENSYLPERLLKPQEVLQVLQISLASLYRMVETRTIPFVRVGGQIRFKRRSLMEWIDRNLHAPIAKAAGRSRNSDVGSKRTIDRGRTL